MGKVVSTVCLLGQGSTAQLQEADSCSQLRLPRLQAACWDCRHWRLPIFFAACAQIVNIHFASVLPVCCSIFQYACTGGGSNFGGLAFPFLREKLAGRLDTRIVAVEPAACPSLTKGKYTYDYGDTAGACRHQLDRSGCTCSNCSTLS